MKPWGAGMRDIFVKAVYVVAILLFMSAPYVFAGAAAPAAGETVDMPMGQSADGEVSLLPEDVSDVQGDENLFGSDWRYTHRSNR